MLHRATAKDIELKEHFGLELISSYQKILIPLIQLMEKSKSTTMTSQEIVYYVCVGQTFIGKLSISVMTYPNETQIWYLYKYKTIASEYKKHRGISASKRKGHSLRQVRYRQDLNKRRYKRLKEN